jgi:hypothetical protein
MLQPRICHETDSAVRDHRNKDGSVYKYSTIFVPYDEGTVPIGCLLVPSHKHLKGIFPASLGTNILKYTAVSLR